MAVPKTRVQFIKYWIIYFILYSVLRRTDPQGFRWHVVWLPKPSGRNLTFMRDDHYKQGNWRKK